MSEVRYLVAGDSAVCVEFGNEISPEINKKIRAFKIAVEKSDIPGNCGDGSDIPFLISTLSSGSDRIQGTHRKI